MPPTPDRHDRLQATRLYLVVTPDAHGPTWRTALEAALATGRVGMVQLREKAMSDDAYVARARDLIAACRAHDALFLVNDRAHLVDALDADGVHVGQDDLPAAEARALVGTGRLLGLSTHDAEEIEAAAGAGADYVGLGPCFPTSSKRLRRAPRGADLVRLAQRADAPLPVFPIGGITPANAPALIEAGARRLAVGAGVLEAPDPAAAVRTLHQRLAAARLD